MGRSIEVIPASVEQRPVLANLLELYAHDFSEFLDIQLGEDGRFGYPQLPLYWSEAGRHPFLIRVNGHLAGFVFVAPGLHSLWDMAEFFVVRTWRRYGVGTSVAHEVWRRFPGTWEVRVMEANISGQHFWEAAIAAFTGEVARPVCIEKNGRRWNVFSFESKGGGL
jgi:predicted acetyltransferase